MKTHAFVHFETANDAEKARLELNGVKITAKYSTTKTPKPVRLCKYETKQTIDMGRHMDNIKCNLLVKNIHKDVSPHNFWNMFRRFGDIKSCKLVIDYLGNSKGYGYISYYKTEDAERALYELNGKDINGKILKVTHLVVGRAIEKKRNNIYVKHIPKNDFSDNDLKVLKNFNPRNFLNNLVKSNPQLS
jgi:polyadenylate-binding protein